MFARQIHIVPAPKPEIILKRALAPAGLEAARIIGKIAFVSDRDGNSEIYSWTWTEAGRDG